MSVIKKWFTVLIVILVIVAMVFVVSCSGSKANVDSSEASGKSEAKENGAAEKANYNIGDTGPAGGLIFYINPNSKADGWQYLETSPNDFPGDANDFEIKWSDKEGKETGATGTAIGAGMSNTEKIIGIQGEGSYAAKLCDDLIINGIGDWFLPSNDELDLIYKNIVLKGIAGIETFNYWSSTEYDATNAYYDKFGGGILIYNGKNVSNRVRAVRAFN